MKVKVLVPGKYMDKNLKAVKCQKDSVLDTKNWYGADMVANGTAEAIDPVEGEKLKKTTKKKSTSSKKTTSKAKNPGEVFMQ